MEYLLDAAIISLMFGITPIAGLAIPAAVISLICRWPLAVGRRGMAYLPRLGPAGQRQPEPDAGAGRSSNVDWHRRRLVDTRNSTDHRPLHGPRCRRTERRRLRCGAMAAAPQPVGCPASTPYPIAPLTVPKATSEPQGAAPPARSAHCPTGGITPPCSTSYSWSWPSWSTAWARS